MLRVGKSNAKLDNLLVKSGALSCAFITACNPGSKRLSDADNKARQSALIGEAGRRGYRLLHGQGVAQDARWPPEASILIIGISRETAKELGRVFGQIAIVFASRGRAVELLLCDESEFPETRRPICQGTDSDAIS